RPANAAASNSYSSSKPSAAVILVYTLVRKYCQRPYRARAEPAVRTADAEPFLVQHDLDPADLLLRQVHFGYARGAAAAVQCRPARRPHRYGRDDLAAAVDDDDLVTHHEVLVSAPLRIDFDERGGHIDNPHARRYRGSDVQREVDVVHARYV